MIDFFILGNPRSGTTLLRLMLNAHSKIVVPPECGFAVWLKNNCSDKAFTIEDYVEALSKTKKIESWNIETPQVKAYLKKNKVSNIDDAISQTYKRYAENLKPSYEAIGDKNNFYIHHIEDLKSMYPTAKYIQIIRDGRDVACSYQKLMKKKYSSPYAPKLPNKIEDIAQEWVNNNETIEANIFEKQYFQIRLEDILQDPIDSLTPLLKFLGFDFEEKMLEYYKTDINSGMEPAEFDQWKSKNKQPLINERELFKEHLTAKEISSFEEIAKNVLFKFNYLT